METDEREHMNAILRDFDRAMLVSRTPEGLLRSRPMALAEVKGDELCFATALDSPKVAELERDPYVNVAVQGKTRFVSLSAKARIVRDREAIDRLWSESWKVWFPSGKDDPNLCLIAAELLEGEYWDDAERRSMRYLFEAAKAYATGTTPRVDSERSAKVRIHPPAS